MKLHGNNIPFVSMNFTTYVRSVLLMVKKSLLVMRVSTSILADHYLVMERGEVIAQGLGSEMQSKGIRQLVSI
jgi:hypothetical protein